MDIHDYVHIHAGWKDISSEVVGSNESVVLTRVETNKEQPSITMSVVVRDDFSWVLQVQGRTFDPLSLPTLPAVWPTLLCSAMKVHNLLKLLGSLRICPGIPDEKFGPIAQSRKGKFLDHSGKYTEAAMYPMFLCVYIHCLQSLLVLNSLYSEASGLSGVYFIIFHYSN